jgi:integrase
MVVATANAVWILGHHGDRNRAFARSRIQLPGLPRIATMRDKNGLLSNGVPLPAVSARLGHADTNVAARIYAHALPADDQRSADTWDAIIKGPLQ